MESATPTPFDTIEIGQRIFHFTPTTDLLNCSLVSKSWHGKLLTVNFWKSLIPKDFLNLVNAKTIFVNPKKFVVHLLCRTENELNQRIANYIISCDLAENSILKCFFPNNLITPCTIILNESRVMGKYTRTYNIYNLYLNPNIILKILDPKEECLRFKNFSRVLKIDYCSIKHLETTPEYKVLSNSLESVCNAIAEILQIMFQNNPNFSQEFAVMGKDIDGTEKFNSVLKFFNRNKIEFYTAGRQLLFSDDYLDSIIAQNDVNLTSSLSLLNLFKHWLKFHTKGKSDNAQVLSNIVSRIDISGDSISHFLKLWKDNVESQKEQIKILETTTYSSIENGFKPQINLEDDISSLWGNPTVNHQNLPIDDLDSSFDTSIEDSLFEETEKVEVVLDDPIPIDRDLLPITPHLTTVLQSTDNRKFYLQCMLLVLVISLVAQAFFSKIQAEDL